MFDQMKNIRKFDFPLDRYENDPFLQNPLLKFRKAKRMKRNDKQQIKVDRRKFKFDPFRVINENFAKLPKAYYMQQIREAVASAPIAQMPRRIRQTIINSTLSRFRSTKIRSTVMNEYMNDVEKNYNETIRTFNVNRFVQPIINAHNTLDAADKHEKTFKFKQAGRTENHSKFLRYRKQLKKRLFLPYPFIRYILHSSYQCFPSVLNEYDGYIRFKGGIKIWLTLMEFEVAAQRDLETNSIFLLVEWYPKIVEIITKYYRKRTHAASQWPQMLCCAKGLINRQITEIKLRTFEHIFDVLKSHTKMPPIKFQAYCSNGRIKLEPSLIELRNSYQRIFNNIAAVATKFPPLEPLIDRCAFVTDETYLKIDIGDVTYTQLMNRLECALQKAYAPILEYVETLQHEYIDLFRDDTQIDLAQFLNEPQPIDAYFEKITYFRQFVNRLQHTVQNRIFDNAIVNQSMALIGLKSIALDFITEIIDKMSMDHKRDCQQICDWFSNVQRRAVEAPKSTETLLENGEFMLQMKNKKITEIREHIQKNLQISGRLIDLREFDVDHFNLQIQTIHWLHSIQDIFEQNASQFEMYKNQFEEHLSTVTKKLTQNIDELIPKLAIVDDMYDTTKLHDYYATLDYYMTQIKCFEDYIKWINKEEKLFKLPVSQYAIVESLTNFVGPFAALIKLCIEWLRYYYIWMDGPFEYLDRVTIEKLVDIYTKEFETTQKYYRNRIKADMLAGNVMLKFRGQTEDPDPAKHPVPLRLCSGMIEWINGFQIGVCIVKIMCNPALRDRHWVEMSEIAGFDLTPDAGTSLRKITKYEIDHLLPNFEIISIGANKELKLQMDLTEMLKQWETIEFPITLYKDANIKILGNIEDIQVLLDDHIIKTLAMRGSAFVKPCEHEVRNWYEKLLRVSQIFDEWLKVQTNWLYLLPILSSKDILVEMPTEERLFTQVNEIYCKYIEMAIKESIVMKMTEAENLLEHLKSANEMLDEIKSGVNAFLERKRLYFSRFFFLSNHEMLQILSETKNPENIQPFLCKCFNGIYRLQVDSGGNIDGMQSEMNETVAFVNRISIGEDDDNDRSDGDDGGGDCGSSVEKWLLNVENEMRWAVRNEVINGYADYVTSERIDWVMNWSQMIILVVAKIFWTSDIHTSLLQQNHGLLKSVRDEINNNLDEITDAIRSPDITHLNRLTLKTLCIQDIHARDVTEKLLANKSRNVDDFEWVAQLRCYWIEKEVEMRIFTASIPYGYEYLGNFQRIIMTPLAERCYRTILLAYQHQLNAAVEGPTATGKSETIKDLAKALAIQLKIFDCTPDLDYRSISRFLKGAANSGAWLCLEDFNRIESKTISVITQQIRDIHMNRLKQFTKCVIQGVELKLNLQCNICIVLNTMDSKRSPIPTNLKTLFRPVTMIHPDAIEICEISLYASGYSNAKAIAKKITKLYEICADLLPSELHYDFGFQSIKMILRVSANRFLLEPDEIEESLVYRSLRDIIVPGIKPKDLPLFNSIIDDLFPKTTKNISNYEWLREAFEANCKENGCESAALVYQKLCEMYEMSVYRKGIALIGNPCTGKSFVLRTLAAAIATKNHISVNEMDIEYVNPKAISLKHLFGEFDPVNMEWSDGVIASIFRRFADTTNTSKFKWIIFDGPISTEWIENLNTALDDNRKLCLSSGEVLNLIQNTLILFEVGDLSHASPSTISRLGMVYFEPDTLNWRKLVKVWMNRCSKKWINESKAFLMDVFDWILPPVLNYLSNFGKSLLEVHKYNGINTTFAIIQMLIDEAIDANADDYQKFLVSWLQAAMVFGIAWGIGGILDEESRRQFDQFHKKIWSGHDDYIVPLGIKSRIDISMPIEGSMNDYYYVFKQKGSWKLWSDFVKRQESDVNQYGVQVVTVDSARYSYLMEMHIKHGKNVMLVGPSGTGKTYTLQHVLRSRVDLTRILPGFIMFNKQTKAKDVHEQLLTKLVKLKRGVYGPPNGMTCAVFIDDLNVPSATGTAAGQSHSSHELLRQIFDYGYVYDLKTTAKIFLNNILVLAACGIPDGARCHSVDIRFLNHFNCFSITAFTEDTTARIANGILLAGYKRSGHAADVLISVNQIVAATMHIYAEIIAKLKPTPEKPHYRFDIRDVFRVCNGCSLLRKESVENKKMFAKIWFHECLRVFCDRLIDADEMEFVFQTLAQQINDTSGTFKDNMEIIFESYTNEDGVVTLDSLRKFAFGSYLDTDTEVATRKYEEISNFERLISITNRCSFSNDGGGVEFETNNSDVILFTYALEHLNRICRILSMPGGNGLIFGSIDSGRGTLIRLATTHICKQKLFELNVEQCYSRRAWHEDIKAALKSAGGMGQQTCLFLTESQLLRANQSNDVDFFVDIEYLLNLGDIPDLWPIDEKQELLEMVRLVAQGGNRNIDISADQVFTFFVQRCRQNLHIVISFNSIGSKLRRYIRQYPSLLTCCTIDLFTPWPDDALEMIAAKFFATLNLTDELMEAIIAACKYFHATGQNEIDLYCQATNDIVMVSSASYLELIRSFTQLFVKKRTEIHLAKSRYESGLNTLLQAAKAVECMQCELNDLEPRLRAMAVDCQKMTTEIELKTIEASVATEQVKRDELVANEQAAAAEEMEDECSKDLAQAVPVLEDALQALNTLKPADITLVKSMKNPPSAVKLVMAAVCVMKGVPPDRINDAASGKKIVDYWGPSKRILGDMGFLQSLKDYDKDDISPDIMKKIRKDFIPHKDFQPHIVAKASSAAEGLCKWIKAIENFESVNTVVLPKKLKLMNAKENLKETRKYLAEKRALAAELEAKVIGLNADLECTNAEKVRTAHEVAMCEQKLKRAEALIGSLESEKSRWIKKAAQLQNLLDHLPGDVLISCGIIAYLGPLPMDYREKCIRNWYEFCQSDAINIPCSQKFNLIACLGDEVEIQDWHMFGLATDNFSIENGILMKNSQRQCLFLDPQQQANKWIKQMESANHLKVVKQSDETYFRVLLDCMRNGHPILIEDIVRPLNICTEPIFNYRISMQSNKSTIRLNSRTQIEIAAGFRLYLTSNAKTADFVSDLSGKMNIINFVFATKGLEENLLDILVLKENPYLREHRDELLQTKLQDKAKLLEHEDAILSVIAESEGEILMNEHAICEMDASKQLYVKVMERQSDLIEADEKIQRFRESYRRVAAYGAILYSCLDQLRHINPMYQFSLDWYLILYNYSIERANRSRDLQRRIEFLIRSILRNFYQNICRSIFDADKLLFSWIFTTRILQMNGQLREQQLNLFMIDAPNFNGPMPEKPNFEWISEKMWFDLNKLSYFIDGNCYDWISTFQTNLNEWKEYFDSGADELPPTNLIEGFTAFEQLLVRKIFHPETVRMAVTEFIAEKMGTEFVTPPPFDIHKCFEKSNILTPLIFILSPGIDPIDTLWLFAERLGYSQSMQIVALGADQRDFIEQALIKAQKQGSWMCIENCHLNTEWLTDLEICWKNMNFYNTNPSFRLWMTSEPTTTFPLNLIQNSIKMTYEKPQGLKANLLNSYQTGPLNTNFYDSCPKQDKLFKQMLYSLTFFDVLVNERQNYSNIGWNAPYEFSISDFQQSIRQLQRFLCNGKETPFQTLQYIIGECFYGGRMTDNYDKRLLTTILSDIFNDGVLIGPPYKFTSIDVYALPLRFEHRLIMKFIEDSIPEYASCDVCGLHKNSDIIFKLKTSNDLVAKMTTAMTFKPKISFDEVEFLQRLIEIQEKLPQPIDTSAEATAKQNDYYGFSYKNSLNIVLNTEMDYFNRLLKIIRETCFELQQAIQGTMVLTPLLEHALESILANRVPEQWQKISYASDKSFASYFNEFCARLTWIQRWWLSMEMPISTYWISAFFQPRQFIEAIKLDYARKYEVAIEEVTIDATIAVNDTGSNESAKDGAYIYGLYLEAAHWNGTCIEEQINHQTIETFPMIHIKPLEMKNFDAGSRLECPIYYTLKKCHLNHGCLITRIWLPIMEGVRHAHWIKRGVVLGCHTAEEA